MTDSGDRKVRLGLALVRILEDGEIALADLIDTVEEWVGEAPAVTREVVDRAEKGAIQRADGDGEPYGSTCIRKATGVR
jgi:hypothetical protein